MPAKRPSLKQKAREMLRRREVIALFSNGHSIADIGMELRITVRMVRNQLHAFLASESLYPSSITPERVAELRQIEAEHINYLRRKLCESMEASSPQDSMVRARLAEASMRLGERLANLFGLDAGPTPGVAIQNNFTISFEKQKEIAAQRARVMPIVRAKLGLTNGEATTKEEGN